MSQQNNPSGFELLLNFTEEFADSFLYSYILQIILIIYMYSCVGSGRYWKIMLVGSIFGMFGAVVEHFGTAWKNTITGYYQFIGYTCYFIAEIGWIVTEFSIPYLNLIKLNTLSQTKFIKLVNYFTIFLFILFAFARLTIGYLRHSDKELYNQRIYYAHGAAFGITAVADGLLSVLIFIELSKSAKKTKEKDGETFNLLKSFKKSSLFILFCVDLMSVILAILNIFTGFNRYGESIEKLIKPFLALKSNFILILAIDAFIFKMRASVDGSYIVSHYLQCQPKLRSNQGEYSEDTPLSKKKQKSKASQMLSINTMMNSANRNSNFNTVSHSSSIPKLYRSEPGKSYSSVSESSYYMTMGLVNNVNLELPPISPTSPTSPNANNVERTTSSYSSVSSCTLTESPTRAYMKGKKLMGKMGTNGISSGSGDPTEKNNNTLSLNAVNLTSLTPLPPSYNNYLKSSNTNYPNTNRNINPNLNTSKNQGYPNTPKKN